MLDSKGRVWMTSTIQGRNNPDWCREGSDHPSAKNFPMARTGRQASYYDPEREVFILIYTCFGTHHLQFAEDDDEPLYFSGGGDVIGWINTRVYDETGDERFSQGWCPECLTPTATVRLASRGTNRASRSIQAATRASARVATVSSHPIDNSVWASQTGPFPGRLVRLDPATTRRRPVWPRSMSHRRSKTQH